MSSLAEQLSKLSPKQRRLLELQLRKKGIEIDRLRIPRRAEDLESYPLSHAQQRLWFLEQLMPGNSAYHILQANRLLGRLEVAALHRALGTIVARHESLRTVFGSDAEGRPAQRVVAPAPQALPMIDLSALPEAAREAELTRQVRRHGLESFDLGRGPLVRTTLLRLAPREHAFLVAIHHLVSDGLSMAVFRAELAALYSAYRVGREVELPPLPLQYPDFALWQRSEAQQEEQARQLEYWLERLAGAPSRLELPLDRPRPPVQTFRGSLARVLLEPPLIEALRRTSRQEGSTFFALLLAIWAMVLSRVSGDLDLVVGTPIGGRKHQELEPLIGLFANMLALRADLSGEPTFRQVLARTWKTVREANSHQDVPLERVIDALELERNLSHNPLFQVAFLAQTRAGGEARAAEAASPEAAESFAGLTWKSLGGDPGTTQFDILLQMLEQADGALAAVVQYNSALFDRTTVLRLAGAYRRMATALAEDLEARPGELSLVSAAECHQLLGEWNDSRADYGEGRYLHELFADQAAAEPERTALRFAGESLSYGELAARVHRLGRHLRSLGVGRESLVGVAMERSFELVEALMGVVAAGAAYVPLDPDYPHERLAFMLADSGIALVLTEERLLAALPEHGLPTVVLDRDRAFLESLPAEPLDLDAGLETVPEQLAYTIFTSGSTGKPKGAMNSHRAILNRILWMQERYRLGPEDRVLQKTPFSFDVSVWEFFWPLAVGARLVLARPGGHQDSAYLAELIGREGVTTLHFVPSMLRAFLAEPDLSACTGVQRVIASGEALTSELADLFHRRLGAELHNLYGPTEAAIDVTHQASRAGAWPGSTVPIGRPVTNTEIHLVDRSGRPVPLGVAGELMIGGVQLARGYLSRPALTAERFVPDPFSERPGARLYRSGDLVRRRRGGEVEFLGRLDHQVKVRGFRIELGEIEIALLVHPEIREAAVVARDDGSGGSRLVAYLVAEGENAPGVRELREFLGESLPAHMIPSLFVPLAEMPLTASGKVDRRSLPEPEAGRQGLDRELVAPRTGREETLAAIWRQVLRIEEVGVEDSFFELGGDSILSLQVIFRAGQEGLEITPQQLFEHQTIAELARIAGEKREGDAAAAGSEPRTALAPLGQETLDAMLSADPGLEDVYPLSPLQEGMLFHCLYSPGASVYLTQLSCVFDQGFEPELFHQAWKMLAERHTIFRTSFRWQGLEHPVQQVHQAVEVPTRREDWRDACRDLSAEEIEARIETFLARDLATPFDLERPPLLRLAFVRLADDAWFFLWSRHHLTLDGWSLPNVMQELFTLYEALLREAEISLPPARPFRDYIAWLARQDRTEAEAYWRSRLAGFRAPTPLPMGRPGMEQAEVSVKASALLQLPPEETKALGAQARRQRLTLNTLVQGAWAVLLSRYAREEDILFGATVSGRPADLPGVESMVGMLINTLPVRVAVPGGAPAGPWLAELQRDQAEARRFEYSALAEVQSWSEVPPGEPLFEALLVFENAPAEASLKLQAAARSGIAEAGGEAEGPKTGIGRVVAFEQTHYPFALVVGPKAGLQLRIGYDRQRFAEATVERALSHLRRLLHALAEAPEAKLGELPWLSAAERRQVLEVWSREPESTALTAPAELPVHAMVAARAAERPAAPAVRFRGETLTYGELDARSNRLARLLRELGAGPEVVVGLALERSFDLVIGVLAILKSGAAYLPLDPELPAERLAFMLEDSAAHLVVTDRARRRVLPEAARSLDLEAEAEALARMSDAGVEDLSLPAHAAYVIYTSGSTGQPKGVVITHGSLANRLEWSRLRDVELPFRYLHKTTISFDVSVLELLVSLSAGGTVVAAEPGGQTDLAYLLGLMAEEEVTHASFTPSLHQVLVEEEGLETLAGTLRTLYTAAEAVSADLPERVRARLPVDFVNRYGPTEATIGVTSWTCPPGADDPVVPIGHPVAGAEIYLLGPSFLSLPAGVPGELMIGGPCLARGYLARPALTAERFVPHPFARAAGERLYATGDLARFREDGAIEFIGRRDNQVKIRGFRVELGEIEALLAKMEEVRQVAVLLREDRPGEKLLVAYLALEPGAESPGREELRRRLEEDVPSYFVPSVVVEMEALPLTPSAKIDRRALPAPDPASLEPEALAMARNPVEEVLAGIWSELLKRPQVGIHQNFFELGGHSLLAMQMIARIRTAFGVELELRTLFEAPTVAELATAVAREKAAGGVPERPPLVPVPREGPLPLTYAQQRMWFLYYLVPGALYNIPTALQMHGPVDLGALRAALAEVVRRHESLRTTFRSVGGDPVQVVSEHQEALLPLVDLSALPEEPRGLLAYRIAQDDAKRPFELDRGPLFRVHLVRLSPREHLMVFNLHHIIADGWSVRVLIREVGELAAAFAAGEPSPLAELPLQMGDFAVWQREWLRGEVLERELGYWRERLAGAPALLELPTDRPRPPLQTFGGASAGVVFPPELTASLARLARQEGATPFLAALALLQALLSRHSGQLDISVGSPSAGRFAEELEGLIGYFVNTLVYRTDLGGEPSFRQLIGRVRETVLEAHAHEELPFEKLVDELSPERNLSHQPIYQVMFVYRSQDVAGEGAPGREPEEAGVGMSILGVDNQTAKFDLEFDLGEVEDFLRGGMIYNVDLFDRTTVRRMLRQMVRLAASAVAEPDLPVSRLELLAPAERRQILEEWNDTARERVTGRSMQELFETRVARDPGAVAVLDEREELTYGELAARVRRLARHLRALGVGPGLFVGVFLERSVDMVAAVLAILEAGGAYVPIETGLPPARVRFILETLEVRVVLGQSFGLETLAAAIRGLPELRHVVTMDAADPAAEESRSAVQALGEGVEVWGRPRLEHLSAEPLPSVTDPGDIAYIIFTSGSTGTPKGVVVRHEPVLNLIRWVNESFRIGPRDRVLFVTSLSFDLSVYDIFGLLAAGASIRVASGPDVRNPQRLAEILVEEPITFWDSAPAALLQTVPFLPPEAPGAPLRLVFQSGDWIPVTLPGRLRATFPAAEVISLGGATEATVWSNFHPIEKVEPHWVSIPYGRPIDNARYHVLDPWLEPCPVGVPGDLYIGGECLASGYSDPVLTAQKFLPDPFGGTPGGKIYRTGDRCRYWGDGNLEFLGRLDAQVKIRGFRIELGEIETVLGEHPGVRDSVVLAREGEGGHKRLVAWVVPREPASAPSLSELRAWLGGSLPEYMVPAAFVFLDELPLTPNGKLDRKGLPEPEEGAAAEAAADYVAPRNDAEQILAEIWRKVLRLERVGIDDNFFELGGDSILGLQVIFAAGREGLQLTPPQVFEHQTVAELAAVAETGGAREAEQGIVVGSAPLLPIQHWFLELSWQRPEHFNHARLLTLPAAPPAGALAEATHRLLLQHDALRLRLERTDEGSWRQLLPEPDRRALPFAVIDLQAVAELRRFEAAVTAAGEGVHRSLRIEAGPLFRVVLFRPAAGLPAHVLFAAHHLVVDLVSWQVMLEDFQTLAEALGLGQEPDLPPKTASIRQWAEAVEELAAGEEVAAEAAYWTAPERRRATELPVERDRGRNCPASTALVRGRLEAEATVSLQQEVHAAYGTQVRDLLLAALALALSRWTGGSRHLVASEGHGRDLPAGGLDVSRTVGWLTSMYPLLLDLEGAPGLGDIVKRVKEGLRTLPMGGASWGLARYLGAEEVGAELAAMPWPRISFNYHGVTAPAGAAEAPAAPAPEPGERARAGAELIGDSYSPADERPFLLDMTAQIAGGELRYSILYSENRHRRETIEAFAESFSHSLRLLIEHCRSPEAGGYTPSDFPLAELDQESLDLLLAGSREIEDVYPLSSTQQGMLFHRLYDPRSVAYFEQVRRVFQGELDVEKFQQAWAELIEQHPILRTSFAWEGLEEPLQIVHRSAEAEWQMLDWRHLEPEHHGARWEAHLKADRLRGFDLRKPPLLRFTLARVGEETTLFNCSYHHILFDGWSGPMLRNEVMARYLALCQGAEAEIPRRRPYRDYIAWLRAQDQAEAEAYWRRALAGYREPISLGLEPGTTRPKQGAERFTSASVRASPEASAELRRIASASQTTLSTLVQAAWGLTLGLMAGRDDVVFGATVSGRSAPLEGMDTMVGLFINTLPVRVRLDMQARFSDWLRLCHQRQAEGRRYEYSLLMEVQKWSEVLPPRMLFESIVVFENFPQEMLAPDRDERDPEVPEEAAGGEGEPAPPEPEFEATEPEPAPPTGPRLAAASGGHFEMTSYPLTLIADPKPQMVFHLGFDQRLFDAPDAQRILELFRVLLEAIAEDPGRRLRELPAMTEEERTAVVEAWNDTARDRSPLPLARLFEERAARDPEATALVAAGREMSYGELDRRANRLAHHLRRLGVGPEVRVGVCAERSIEQMVAVLAVLKAGGAYLPLDPKTPVERLAYFLRDSGAEVLLTQKALVAGLPSAVIEERRIALLALDELEASLADLDGGKPPAPLGDGESLAYLIYTSGSTGLPKAVMISQAAAGEYAQTAAENGEVTTRDRVLQFASLSFDASVEEIFPTWIRGGALVLRDEEMLALDRFFPACDELGITVLDLPTAYWHELVAAMEREPIEVPASVRLVILGGERARPEAVAAWHDQVGPHPRLVNTYGPTEATVVATLFPVEEPPVERETATSRRWYEVPIGVPRANTRAYVATRELALSPLIAPGELLLGGAGLARGYLGRAGLTAERFVPDPWSGRPGERLYRSGDLVSYDLARGLVFRGRIDDQVKVRGFRVELGEIESLLRAHPGLEEAAVVAEGEEGVQLLAWVVPAAGAAGEEVAEERLRSYLRQHLPTYMLPSRLISLQELPMTASGKVDRAALPRPGTDEPAGPGREVLAPRDETERVVVEIWEDLFERSPIGVEDDFFELGGDSIRALRMIARLKESLGRTLPLAALFERGTPAALAERLREAEAEGPWSPLEAIQPRGERPPIFFVHPVTGNILCYREVARALGEDQPSYGLRAAGLDAESEPLGSIEAMAESYLAAIRELRAEGPYVLASWSAGGVIAFEMARQLRAAGVDDVHLILIDANIAERFPELREFSLMLSFADQMGIPVRAEPGAVEELRPLAVEAQLDALHRLGQVRGGLALDMSRQDFGRYWAVFVKTVQALLAYRTRPWAGDLHFLHAEAGTAGRAEATGKGLTVSWEPFIEGEILTQPVPGATHENMVTGPRARVLARKIRTLLRKELAR